MKTPFLLLLLAFVMLGVSSCSNDELTDIGSSVQPAGDQILVSSESFDIQSDNYYPDYLISRADSFLLGTFYDEKYGTTHADVFAQVQAPENFVYPAGSVPDSIKLVVYYQKYFGDRYSPMHLSVYEMNKGTFEYSKAYKSNIDPADYTDKSILLGKKSFTAVDAVSGVDSTMVRIKLSDDFLQRFTNIGPDTYASDENFINFFKGVYVTSDFGSATMLYVKKLYLQYFFHYTYPIKGSQGQDSTAVVNSTITFPANELVRQVNRFMHPDAAKVRAELEASAGQLHYISSPANVYTRINLPLKEMQQKMEGSGLRLAVNYANLRINIDEEEGSTISQPIPTNVLMIKESAIDRFFSNRELPTDSTAVLGSYSYNLNDSTKKYEFFYSFDLAGLIVQEFKTAREKGEAPPVTEKYVLVPVRLKYDENKSITDIGPQYLMQSVTICGGNHLTRPMSIRTVFSGF